jgi:hypothetical protein
MSDSLSHALVCHPAAPDACVRAIGVSVLHEADGGLSLVYRLDGDPAALRIPDGATALPPERLWAHTCFEAFVGTPGEAAYREFNFSPNGQWMRFDFSGCRERIESPVLPAPQITPRLAGDVLELAVRLGAEQLPPGELCVGLTAVVEAAGGRHSYWSLRHPAGQPDFHHREGFALALRVPTP